MNFRTDFTYPDGTRESLLDIGVTALPKGWVFISSRKDYNDPNYRAIDGHYSPALAREVAAAILAAADEAEGIEPGVEVVPDIQVGQRLVVVDNAGYPGVAVVGDVVTLLKIEDYALGLSWLTVRGSNGSTYKMYDHRFGLYFEPAPGEDSTCLPPVEELPLSYVMQVVNYLSNNAPAAA